ncbi:hypothetical protein Dimus_002833 [Dionaea muscipula]
MCIGVVGLVGGQRRRCGGPRRVMGFELTTLVSSTALMAAGAPRGWLGLEFYASRVTCGHTVVLRP